MFLRWGYKTQSASITEAFPRKASQTILSNSDCQTKFSSTTIRITNDMLCAFKSGSGFCTVSATVI